MKKTLFLIFSLVTMVLGLTSAFTLSNSSLTSTYAWLVPALMIGVGVGLSLRFNSGRRTALLLAVSAAVSLALTNNLFPDRRISFHSFKTLFVGASREGQVRSLVVADALRQAPFDKPLQLKSPANVEVSLWTRLPAGVADICFSTDGDLYASLPSLGVVYRRQVNSAPGQKREQLFLHGLDNPTGLSCLEDRLAVAEIGRIAAFSYLEATPHVLVDRLPVDGGNLNHRLLATPDGLLFSIGSRCDACDEPDQRRATLFRIGPDGKASPMARGLRDIGGLARSPEDERIWATERSRLYPAPGAADELNLIQQGHHYGWPLCDGETPDQAECDGKDEAVILFKKRANPGDILFSDTLDFPAVYQDSLIMTLQGAPEQKVRPAVVRLPFSAGEPQSPVPFLGGWDGRETMPSALEVGPDRALYIGDAISGAIYRVAWQGGI